MSQKIEISLPVANAVMQYLFTRPYQEVAQLVQALTVEFAPKAEAPEGKVEETEKEGA